MRNTAKSIAIRLLVGFAALYFPLQLIADTNNAATMPTEPAPNPLPAIGDPAPPIAATDLQGAAVTLDQFHGTPVVLQFGSLTDPIFRMHCPAVETLATTYGKKAQFIIVYQHEAHPAGVGDDLQINVDEGFSIAAPANLDERTKLAAQAVARLNISQQHVVVDAWNDTTSRRYGGLANMTFVIDANGKLAAAYPWMDTRKLDGALDDVLSGKPVSEAHRGPLRSSGAAILVQENNDNLGPAHFAYVIDNLHLNEQQKPAVYPILADYVSEIQTLRQQRNGKLDGGKAKTAVTATTAPATTMQADAEPPMTQAELFAKVRDVTDAFETHLKPLLTDAQYTQLVNGLNRPLGGRKNNQ